MADINKYDDPIWDYVMVTKLTPYLEAVRKFWDNILDIDVSSTGVHSIKGDDVPPGLMYRVTNTPVRSPIKNIQVFPFVPVAYLQISNVAGGANRMVSRLCADNNFKLEEFTIIEKNNLPSTYHHGQFVAFVPTEMLEDTKLAGKWVYLKAEEMVNIMQGVITDSIKNKLIRYI